MHRSQRDRWSNHLLAVTSIVMLACQPRPTAVAPSSPAVGGDFVAAAEAPAPAPGATRPWRDALRGDRIAMRIPDHTPTRGAKDPLVTIVQFGDYTDAASATQARAIGEALRRWPEDVRVAFVHLPSQMRPLARTAAQTASAAGTIDRFWEVHDRLFAAPPKTRADLERIVEGVGLDVGAWSQAIAGNVHLPWIQASIASARELGVTRAGAVFVNGRAVGRESDSIATLVASERDAIAELVRAGLPRADIYPEILAVANMPVAAAAALGGDKIDPAINYAVPAAGRPVLGPVDAPVTIIVFSDFQCPFCARVQETLNEIRKRHPDEVRIVFRNLPLAFHAQARDLAKLALAADAQGKFWPMHDLIFSRKQVGPVKWKPLAKRLRLDAGKLARAMKSGALEQKIVEDEMLAKAFGVSGTPTFFINGRLSGGAQPVDAFEILVREELAKAAEFVANDPGGAGTVYDRMIEGFAPGEH